VTDDEGRHPLSLDAGTPMPIPIGTGAACSAIETVPDCDATKERDADPRALSNVVHVTVVGDVVVTVGVVVASSPHAVLLSTTAALSTPNRRVAMFTDT
jgi:hypothetical protein